MTILSMEFREVLEREDLQSFFTLFIALNPLSQHAVDMGRIKTSSTNIAILAVRVRYWLTCTLHEW